MSLAQSDSSLAREQTLLNIEGIGTSQLAKLPDLATTVPANTDPGIPVRPIGESIFACSFADVSATLASTDFTIMTQGAGHGVSQASGNLLITTGTSVNSEFLARSVNYYQGAMIAKYKFIASQRIANQNFAFLLGDLVGENLACTINSTVLITVTKVGHGYTASNIGQSMMVGGIIGAAGVPGRYAIAAIPSVDTIQFTVAGWPASGSCTVDLFGHSYIRNLYNGTTATASLFDTQRKGWANGDTTTAMLTSASPGHIFQIHNDGRQVYGSNSLVASVTAPNFTMLSTKFENLPDDNLSLYIFLWSYNGTVAPATTTTWTLGFVSLEKFANTPVYIAGIRPQGTQAPLPVLGQGTQTVSGTVTVTSTTANIGTSGLTQYTDSATNLGISATFTGTARDGGATAAYNLFVASAFADQAGTLRIEKSTDNVTYRLALSVALAAGEAKEITARCTTRYYRVVYVNGAVAQTAFLLTSAYQRI